MQPVTLHTPRLVLRQWQASDYAEFANMNADPAVMAFYPHTLSRIESDELADRFSALIAEKTWGFWAVELRESRRFIGFVGLHEPSYDLPVTPCVEIGWRLAQQHWGKGYATEAALACVEFAFTELAWDVLYSFTSVANSASRAVMERIGMTNLEQNFEHPIIPLGHSLSEHVLYHLTKAMWKTRR